MRRRGGWRAVFEEIAEVPGGLDARWALLSLLHALAGAVLAVLDLPGPTLAVFGLAMGLAGWPEAACGAAVAVVLLRLGHEPLVSAALPILAGYGTRLAHFLPERWRSPERRLAQISRFGPFIRPPLPIDRFWSIAMMLTTVAPMVASTVQTWWGWALPACASALAVQMILLDRAVRHEHRVSIRVHRFVMASGNAVAMLVAAGPVGGWFAARWSEAGFLTGWLGGALICAVVFAIRFVWPGRLRVMTAHWLFPFWTVAVFHPTPGAVAALAPLLLAETCAAALADRPMAARLTDRYAAFMIQLKPENRMNVLGPWLYDGFLREPGTADFGLVRRYLGMAVHASRGGFVTGQSTIVNKDPELKEPLDGLRWIALATQALWLVDEEVTPRVPVDLREPLTRARSEIEAELVLTKALVLTFDLTWNDALREWREAAVRFRSLGLRAEEAACRAGTADVLDCLGRAEDARRERARIPSDAPEPCWDLLDERVRDGLPALSADRQDQADRPRVEAA
ncbi:hypothetical protein F5972_20355 [Microbispora cellulosiformans]|uniref:Uncharacterized protein n=1 Tax=Microbispora cellulosiformans TaxID=2614688 RepID=A0A5J5JZT6_9ACTN|nr:hypothetical protein [Microbispora cellulosiformans]KAA9376830.1 hypothetical protein F5972_20355 [Microbispora cellulosiformans]